MLPDILPFVPTFFLSSRHYSFCPDTIPFVPILFLSSRQETLTYKKAPPDQVQWGFFVVSCSTTSYSATVSRRVQLILIVVSTVSILYCLLGIADVLVSQQYETSTDDCISDVTGRDLCSGLRHWQWATGLSGAVTVLLILLPYKTVSKK
jgi:hypothetical protein